MKKKLLLLSIILLNIQTIWSQVPSNDLIENATLINSFPFTDSNVRLDLATASGISPVGCNTGTYKKVYYKFTATESSQLEVIIEDSNSDALGASFAIIFTAPNLNATDDSELTIASACNLISSTILEVVQGTNYYILIYRDTANAFSNIIFKNTPILPVPTSERNALIALYNSTNGDNWNNNTNWNSSERVADWYGITTTVVNGVGHVSRISLGGNNLTGALPTEIGDFPQLTNLLLWSNQLTGNIPSQIGNLTNLVEMDLSPNTFTGSVPTEMGNLVNLEILWLNQNGLSGSIPASFQNLTKLRQLYLLGSVGAGSEWSSSAFSGDFPDLTALPLEILYLQNNFFEFSDIADEFATYQANIANFIFSPQFTVDAPQEVITNPGTDVILSLTDVTSTGKTSNLKTNLASNTYQWFKDNVAISGANANSFTITNAQTTDSGYYYCEITNLDVPGMTIQRQIITLNIGGGLSLADNKLNALSIYPNPTTGILNFKLNKSQEAKVKLYDVTGKVIQTKSINSLGDKLNLSYYPKGIYFLNIETENTSTTKRVVKE